MNKAITLCFLSLTLSFSLYAKSRSSTDYIKKIDSKNYSNIYQEYNSIIFNVDSSALTKKIQAAATSDKKNKSLHARVTVRNGKELSIELLNDSKANAYKKEISDALTQTLSLVFSPSLKTQLQGFEVMVENQKNGMKYLKAIDESSNGGINEVNIFFRKDGRVTKTIIKRPIGTETSTYKYVTGPYDKKNHWLLSRVDSKSIDGTQVLKNVTKIKYLKISGLWLPSAFDITTSQVVQKKQGNKITSHERNIPADLKLSSFKVNKK